MLQKYMINQKKVLLQALQLTMVERFKLKPQHIFHNILRTIFVESLLFLPEPAALEDVLP